MNKIFISPDSSINKDISATNIETEKNLENNNNDQINIKKEEQITSNINIKTEDVLDNKEERKKNNEKII